MAGKSIVQVVKDGLCNGCGTCIALCPKEIIKLNLDDKKGIYVPKINIKKCNNCGTCFKVCPGQEVDFKNLTLDIFGKNPDNILVGNYLKCYVGNSKSHDIRFNSTSGGLVTQLLIHALDEGIISGAIVTKMNFNKPLEPEPFIARTKEEIIEASKSKYCPVPVNIALKQILKSEKNEKFAVVGLPCHIQGIRKAENSNSKLKEKISLHIGLFCGYTPNFLGTEFLLSKLGIEKENIRNLSYRCEGWPGNIKINLMDDDVISLPVPNYFSNYISSKCYFFSMKKCFSCVDGTCELADISFGDAWLPEMYEDKIGTSIVISKTINGDKLLQSMASKNKIQLKEINVEKVIESQRAMLYFKKIGSNGRKIFFNKISNYNTNLLEPDFIDKIISLFPYFNAYMFSKPLLRKILYYIPPYFLWLYGYPYSILISIKSKDITSAKKEKTH